MSEGVSMVEFYKCGEIAITLGVERKNFAFICIFCSDIYLQFEEFTSHIEKNHYNELYGLDNTTEEVDHNENIDSEHAFSEDPIYTTNLQTQDSHQNRGPSILNDPLEEGVVMEVDTEVVSSSTNQESDNFSESLAHLRIETCESVENDETRILKETSNDDTSYDESCGIKSGQEDGHNSENDVTNTNLLLALIDEYKKHRPFWDEKAMNRIKREETIKAIAQAVSEKLNTKITSQDVSEKIKELREKFSNELQIQCHSEARENVCTNPSIYFEKLSFLKEFITYKPRNYIRSNTKVDEKSVLSLPKLTDDQNVKFIGIYKRFPCLWNTQNVGFHFKAQRDKALIEMIQTVKSQLSLSLTQDELLNKLYSIRCSYTEDKQRMFEFERLKIEFKPSYKYFQDLSFLFDHVGPFKCDSCEKVFNSSNQYSMHKSTHDGSMPFHCPICERGFTQAGNLTVHVRRHTRDLPFECKFCGKHFATTTDVNVHMRYHTGEKPFICEVCGQSSRTWSIFNAHMRRHQNQPRHVCSICDKAFYENNKLTDHMKAHFNVRDWICIICGKGFTSSKNLRQHEQIHSEKKKYVCMICKKDFAQYAGLCGHMRSHKAKNNSAAASNRRSS